MIPSDQRATILSFDSLFSSAGGIVAQPALSRSADVWGYPVSYLFSAAGSALALPFLWRARQLADSADTATGPVGDSAPVTEGQRTPTSAWLISVRWVGCHVSTVLTH